MSTFLKTGRAEKPSASDTCDRKASNSKCLCRKGDRLLLFRKVLSVLMLKGILRELLPKSFSSVQSLSRVRLFATPSITACQASLSITNSQSLLRLMPIESVIHPAISSSVVPFSSCPQPLPASGSFPMSQLEL